MNRRSLIAALPLALLAAHGAAAQEDHLRSQFDAMPPAARQVVQEQLATGGFYSGRIDAAFGPGTRRALVDAAAFLEWNSRGRVAFDLSSPGDVRRYLAGLAGGELAAYLYGEGEEMDG
jgi:peptidoglycan hydrolase-like protein with peptidoglycan-binding domain